MRDINDILLDINTVNNLLDFLEILLGINSSINGTELINYIGRQR